MPVAPKKFVPREGTELVREQKDFEVRQEGVGDMVEVLKSIQQQLSRDDCNPSRYLSVREGLSERGILSNRLGNYPVGLDLI